MANVWDPQRNVWVDDQTGNTNQPAQYGGDGQWHSPDGRVYVNGQWSQPQQQIQPPSFAGSNGGLLPGANPLQQAVTGNSSTQNGAFQTVPGSDYLLNQQQNDAQYGFNTQNNQSSQQLEQMREQSALSLANLNAQVQQETAKGNNASAERIAQLNYQISQEQNRISLMNAQTQQSNQAMQERQLQANLAANPNDFVAYEYYKRALGNPSALGAVANSGGIGSDSTPAQGAPVTSNTGNYWSNGATEGSTTSDGKWMIQNGAVVANPNSSASQVATPSVAATGNMLNGGSYSAAPPAYSDQTLSNVGNSIQGGGQAQWNPNLSGQGAFGTQIEAPNQIGRNTYGNLSPSEQAIMNSFLNAGINMGGHQVSIDPTDYLKQMQNSWIPSLQGGTGQNTQYQE